MEEVINRLNKQLKFKCFYAGDKTESLGLVVDTHNELNPPANETDIDLLKNIIKENNSEIVEFYKKYNGLKLYCHEKESGLEIFPISEIASENEGWKAWFQEGEELKDYEKEGVAFGAVSRSGNYLVLFQGKVFYYDHEGNTDSPIVESFNEFLDIATKDPIKFLNDMGCNTRYSDGKTDKQWIPKEIVL
jgi:hypothetical protein